jgi:NTE family protein
MASLDIVLGDNYRYDFDYYIENGYNLSFGFKSFFNQFNRNVTSDISSLNFESLGLNTINIDFSDMTIKSISNLYLYRNFDRWRLGV